GWVPGPRAGPPGGRSRRGGPLVRRRPERHRGWSTRLSSRPRPSGWPWRVCGRARARPRGPAPGNPGARVLRTSAAEYPTPLAYSSLGWPPFVALCPTLPRPWVRGRVDFPQCFLSDLRVDLGRRHRGVSEQLLDDADVRSAFEQMCGEGVPEGVRGHLGRQTGVFGRGLDDLPGGDP